MKNLIRAHVYLSLAIGAICSVHAAEYGRYSESTVTSGLTSMPLAFTENLGQWPDSILFCADAGGPVIWFTKEGSYYQFTRLIVDHDGTGVGIQTGKAAPTSIDLALEDVRGTPDSLEIMMIKAGLVGSNPIAEVTGAGLLEYKCNYFLGNDPAVWHTDVPNYSSITIEEIYPGIDLTYYGDGHRMEYDFRVAAGADYSQIRIQYDGVKAVSVDTEGALVVRTDWGEIRELAPVVYQNVSGVRKLVPAEFIVEDARSFRFELGPEYDPSRPVVIDPVLEYSTYLGGGSTDWGFAIAADADGAAYVTGRTISADFPTVSPFQTFQGDHDAFITKVDASGSSLIYSTYLGGEYYEYGEFIAVDTGGQVYVIGYTSSLDFPTLNPYQTDQGGYDAFVTKLNSAGNSLVYSTYLGGSGTDYGESIAIDTTGAAYVAGRTLSSDFPTLNAYQTDQGGSDAFVAKLNTSGNSLSYSTYLGGGNTDEGWAIAVDASGAVWVVGTTESSNFPTLNPYQTYQGLVDVFVTKLSSSGSSLVHSTYLGGSGDEFGKAIAVDSDGAAYVTGGTNSIDFPTLNPYQTHQGDYDVFVTKVSSGGGSLDYGTFLGGSLRDFGRAIAVNAAKEVFVTGYTHSTDFPTLFPYQTDAPSYDIFLTKLNSSGNSLGFSTYFGGASGELAWGIAVDTGRGVYLTGWTGSSDFPTLDPFQTDQGGQDAYVLKFIDRCCNGNGLRGNVDFDPGDATNIADLTYLVDYLYRGGPAAECLEEANVDGDVDEEVNVGDLTYLVDFLFRGGPEPAACPE